ncbi:MAG: inositol monophosphatase [Chloroflexia bacterium]|nr:inositol monophosphatase [Chloroflexia bacterium]
MPTPSRAGRSVLAANDLKTETHRLTNITNELVAYNDTLNQALQLARDLAIQAGAILRDRLHGERQVVLKGAVDLVTDADHASEQLIWEGLRAAFPTHRITGEEGSVGAEATIAEQPFGWVFDPLDGTTNYAHRYPHFAVSICLEHRGAPVVGVVYDPMRDELFAARQGQGATLNGQPIVVSTTETLGNALLASGFSYDLSDRPGQMVLWEAFNDRARGVRRDGAAALNLCYVACGRLDGYWERPIQSWDMGAGVVIVREAGGDVTALEHDDFDLYTPEVLATNPHIHGQMRDSILTASK